MTRPKKRTRYSCRTCKALRHRTCLLGYGINISYTYAYKIERLRPAEYCPKPLTNAELRELTGQ